MKERDVSEIRYIPVRQYLRRRMMLRWALMLGVLCAFAGLCLIARRFCTPDEQKLMLGLSALVYVFILWKSRTLHLTFSREWTGTVLSCVVHSGVKPLKGVTKGFRATLIGKWSIRRDNRLDTPDGEGEELTLRFDTEEIGERYFRPGERVRMYARAKYPVKLHPAAGDENLMCPLCSLATRTPRCERCKVTFDDSGDDPKNCGKGEAE